jgi:nicotinate-nucleotide adenylyltransferase
MKTGVFGGSFDPPHIAHLILADEAQAQLGLERVLWVLTPDNPLKEGSPATPLQDRIDMLQAAIAGNPAFEFSRVDIDRPPPYYSFETMQLLGKERPQAELVFLMGSDSLRDLLRWKQPEALLAASRALAVMRRPGIELDLEALEAQLPGAREKVRFIEAPLLEISASGLRQRAATGSPIRYFLPAGVYEIVRSRGLYGYGNRS